MRDRLIGYGAALPGGAVALIPTCSSFLCAVGEQLAALGFAVEQPAQEAGDLAFTGAWVENSTASTRWKRDDLGSVAMLTAAAI